MVKYTVERIDTDSWTEKKKYVIKEGRKEVLKFHYQDEAEEVCAFLNKINGKSKRKTSKKTSTASKDDGKKESKKEKKD